MFLSKTSEYLSKTKTHAYMIGFTDGFDYHGKGYRLKFWITNNEEVEDAMIYYDWGYFTGRSIKYSIGIILTVYFGLPKLM